jgi:hypothetical protein
MNIYVGIPSVDREKYYRTVSTKSKSRKGSNQSINFDWNKLSARIKKCFELKKNETAIIQ